MTLAHPGSGYTLDVVVSGDRLEARIAGQRPDFEAGAAHESTEVARAIAEAVRRAGCRRLLVEIDITGQATSTNSYRMAKQLGALGFERGLRIACVFRQPNHFRVNQLGVRLAAGDGWDIAAFDRTDHARDWLARPLPPG